MSVVGSWLHSGYIPIGELLLQHEFLCVESNRVVIFFDDLPQLITANRLCVIANLIPFSCTLTLFYCRFITILMQQSCCINLECQVSGCTPGKCLQSNSITSSLYTVTRIVVVPQSPTTVFPSITVGFKEDLKLSP